MPVPEPPPDMPEQAESSRAATASGRGELRINSLPVSKVVLDGKPLGSTPRVGVEVPAGPHTVMFVYPTGERHTTSTYVRPGTIQTVKDRLEGKPAKQELGMPGPGF